MGRFFCCAECGAPLGPFCDYSTCSACRADEDQDRIMRMDLDADEDRMSSVEFYEREGRRLCDGDK